MFTRNAVPRYRPIMDKNLKLKGESRPEFLPGRKLTIGSLEFLMKLSDRFQGNPLNRLPSAI
jgi:hypothetical protein